MLADPKVKALIAETGRIINRAISSSLPEEIPEAVRYALEHNGFVFSGFKTYHSLKEVGLSLTTDEGKIKPYNAFLEDVHKIDKKYNKNYLYAEYNHAIAASQMAAKWHEWKKDGDEYLLQYRTAGDDRVRPEHAALNGITLPMSDHFWDKYLPPLSWNCRCTTVQVRKEKYGESDAEVAMAAGDAATDDPKLRMFRFNPGKTMEVFPPKHPYLPKGCGSCNKKKLNLVGYDPSSERCRACLRICEEATKECKKAIYERLKDDPKYKDVEYNEETGGLKAEHVKHNDQQGGTLLFPEDDRDTRKPLKKRGVPSIYLERESQKILYQNGHVCILMSEDVRNNKGQRTSQLDTILDDIRVDIRSITKNEENTIEHSVTKKKGQIKTFNSQNGTDYHSLILHFHKPEYFNENRIRKALGTTINTAICTLNEGEKGKVIIIKKATK